MEKKNLDTVEFLDLNKNVKDEDIIQLFEKSINILKSEGIKISKIYNKEINSKELSKKILK